MRGPDDDLDERRGGKCCRGGGRDEPVEPQGRAEGRDAPAEQEHDPDIQERVEREVRDVGRGREGWIAAVPEVEEDVAEGRGDQRGADEEPGRALGADESRARKTAERGEQLETFVQPGLV